MSALIIDGIIILIIAVTVYFSSKRGFVRTLIEVVGGLIAVFVVVTASVPVADFFYEKTVEPVIVSSAEKSIEKANGEAVDKLWESFPDFVTDNAPKYNITKKSLSNKLEKAGKTEKDMAKVAANTVAKPILTRVISTVFSLAGIIILLFLVRLLAKVINRLFNFSIIGKINRFLGGTLGIAKGIVFSLVFCLVVSFILSVTKSGFWVFTKEAISNTYFFKHLYGILPFRF